jgi:hypothetical protein
MDVKPLFKKEQGLIVVRGTLISPQERFGTNTYITH